MSDHRPFPSLASHSPKNGSPPSQSPPASPAVNVPQPQQKSDRHTQEENSLSSYCIIPSITSHSANVFLGDDLEKLTHKDTADAISVGIASVEQESDITEDEACATTGKETTLDKRSRSEEDEVKSKMPESGKEDNKNRDSGAMSDIGSSIVAASHGEESVRPEETEGSIYHAFQESTASSEAGKSCVVIAGRSLTLSSQSKLQKHHKMLNLRHYRFPMGMYTV